ncbi:YicC/YloC family endoribonuclease [Paenibacillus chartarius]|uniref:YicC/YloC family endoribonuclease n=1 Tax=Paenibacillus chartarius TaxID=747481 RepID=A0ABV6DTR8_9BACL
MMRSMTGFGQAEAEWAGNRLTIDVRSVNHRYLETVFRLPREFQSWEDPLRKTVQRAARRGRFDVSVALERGPGGAGGVQIDWALADAYADAAQQLQARFGLNDRLTLNHLLSLPNIVVPSGTHEDKDNGIDTAVQALQTALDALNGMREAEGRYLAADLQTRLDTVERWRQQMSSIAPRSVKEYAAKLRERIRELLQSEAAPDEQRLAAEVAFMADRSNIDEELTRLGSHIQQFRTLLGADEAVGRKLDFLIQEMNREVNTIGSKSASGELSGCVIETKAELEKMREQVQNIE